MTAILSKRTALLCSVAIGLACPAIAQESEAFVLDPILLAKSKREVQTDTAISTTTVDQEEIEDRQASTIAELVDSVPGVSLINGTSPQGSGINIRGFGANGTYGSDQKVLIQVDDADVGAEELYRIGTQLYTDPQLYKEVNVIRGIAGTLEFGSGAIGGLVRLETKDASDFTQGEIGMKIRQTLQFSSNAHGIASSTILAWQPTDDFEMLAHFSYSESDDYKDGSGATVGNTSFGLPSWQIKARKSFGDGTHALSFSINDTNSSDKDVPYDQFQTTSGSFGNVNRDIHTRGATVKYEYNPADNDLIDFSATLSYADQQIDTDYVDGSSPFQGGMTKDAFCANPFFGVICADHRYETTKLTLKNTSLFDTGAASHNLRAGLEFKRRERLTAASAPGGTDKRVALFLVDDISFDNLTLTPALRYESQDIEGYSNDALMGALSAHYKFGNGFAVFGSLAYTESLPILDDQGNPAYMTQSEKAQSVELGFAYDKQSVFAADDDLSFKLTAYKTDVSDVTSATSPTMTAITDIEMQGVEIEAAYGMANGFYVDLNANIVDGSYTVPTPAALWRGVPADSLRLTLGKKWGEATDLSWEVVTNKAMEASAWDSASSGWTAHNLRATFKPQSGVFEGTEIRVGIENVFNKTYQPRLATYNAPGRTFKLSIAKTF